MMGNWRGRCWLTHLSELGWCPLRIGERLIQRRRRKGAPSEHPHHRLPQRPSPDRESGRQRACSGADRRRPGSAPGSARAIGRPRAKPTRRQRNCRRSTWRAYRWRPAVFSTQWADSSRLRGAHEDSYASPGNSGAITRHSPARASQTGAQCISAPPTRRAGGVAGCLRRLSRHTVGRPSTASSSRAIIQTVRGTAARGWPSSRAACARPPGAPRAGRRGFATRVVAGTRPRSGRRARRRLVEVAPVPRGGQAALLAGVLDQPVGLDPHELHVELHLAAKHAQDETGSVAGLAPAPRRGDPHQARPVLGPVGRDR